MRATQVALLLCFCITGVFAQGADGKNLQVFYQQNCARCHGPDGSAVSRDGKKLSGQDLTSQEWQNKTEDAEMVKTILNGKFFGLAMPGFEDVLTEEEAQRMVTEIIRKSEKGRMIAPDVEEAGGK